MGSSIKAQIKSGIIGLSRLPLKNFSRDGAGDIYMVLTIDTEQNFGRTYTDMGVYRNIEAGIPSILDILDCYKCKASWMVTPEVAIVYPDTIKDINDEKHEIGCHLHPEYFTEQSIIHTHYKQHLCNLPIDTQRDMIRKATDILEKSIGKHPHSFRAGKYGINDITLDLLKKEGYLVDTSVSPNVDWSYEGGPNWSKVHSTKPYFQDTLLEVPITIIKVMGLNHWFRPSVSTMSAMKTIVEIIRLQQKGPIILNMMFHSSESVDPNPYLKSEILLKRLRAVLEYLYSINTKFITLDQLYKIMKERTGEQ